MNGVVVHEHKIIEKACCCWLSLTDARKSTQEKPELVGLIPKLQYNVFLFSSRIISQS